MKRSYLSKIMQERPKGERISKKRKDYFRLFHEAGYRHSRYSHVEKVRNTHKGPSILGIMILACDVS